MGAALSSSGVQISTDGWLRSNSANGPSRTKKPLEPTSLSLGVILESIGQLLLLSFEAVGSDSESLAEAVQLQAESKRTASAHKLRISISRFGVAELSLIVVSRKKHFDCSRQLACLPFKICRHTKSMCIAAANGSTATTRSARGPSVDATIKGTSAPIPTRHITKVILGRTDIRGLSKM